MTNVKANIFALLDGEETEDVQQLVQHVEAKAKASSRPSTADKAANDENDKEKKIIHHSIGRYYNGNGRGGRGRGRGRGYVNGNYSQDNNGYVNGNYVDNRRQVYNGNYQQNNEFYRRRGQGGNFSGRRWRGEVQSFETDDEIKDNKEQKVTSNGNDELNVAAVSEVPKEPETEEEKAKREKKEKELKAEQEQREREYKARQEEREKERRKMTLQQYEKQLAEKRKALEASKLEERKVTVDKELESMQLVRKNKEHDDDMSIKNKSEKDKLKDKEGKGRKVTMSIDEFIKKAEEEERKKREEIEEERRRQQQNNNNNNRRQFSKPIQRPKRSVAVKDERVTGAVNGGVGKSQVEEFPVLGK